MMKTPISQMRNSLCLTRDSVLQYFEVKYSSLGTQILLELLPSCSVYSGNMLCRGKNPALSFVLLGLETYCLGLKYTDFP